MCRKYHVFNFLLDSQYQDFNVSIKPVKSIKNYMKKYMLIIFNEIFFVSFIFVIPIAYFVYTLNLKQIHELFSIYDSLRCNDHYDNSTTNNNNANNPYYIINNIIVIKLCTYMFVM